MAVGEAFQRPPRPLHGSPGDTIGLVAERGRLHDGEDDGAFGRTERDARHAAGGLVGVGGDQLVAGLRERGARDDEAAEQLGRLAEEVETGDELPGGNRVLAIRRLGGNWAVVTERGIISAR